MFDNIYTNVYITCSHWYDNFDSHACIDTLVALLALVVLILFKSSVAQFTTLLKWCTTPDHRAHSDGRDATILHWGDHLFAALVKWILGFLILFFLLWWCHERCLSRLWHRLKLSEISKTWILLPIIIRWVKFQRTHINSGFRGTQRLFIGWWWWWLGRRCLLFIFNQLESLLLNHFNTFSAFIHDRRELSPLKISFNRWSHFPILTTFFFFQLLVLVV